MNLLKQKTLLYAEDEIIIQKQYSQYFRNYFKTVLTALDGDEAYKIYYNKKPDVLILDINMPKLNGLEVAKKIREYDVDTKIILLTGRSDKETLKEAIELGLTTYLEKPITRESLKNTLVKLAQSLEKDTLKALWYINGDYYIWDSDKMELKYKDKQILLTKQENLLFQLFIVSNERNITYQDIYEAVWYDDFSKEFKESTIKTLISGLRIKLPPKAIKNAYGMGYFFNIY